MQQALIERLVSSVINAFKSMLQEDDIIGEEDMFILGKIRAFAVKVSPVHPASKRLIGLVETVVSGSSYV